MSAVVLSSARVERSFEEQLDVVQGETHRVFRWLLLAQWAVAIMLAAIVSPYGWEGTQRAMHLHVKLAVAGGALINSVPLLLVWLRPGWWLTRHSVAAAQMLWSGLLIHLTDGRIESHFHIFGSLAFIAFYRDWKLLITATVLVAGDHLARGFLNPESVYGLSNPEWWRFLEHASWVLFEDVVLVLACQRALKELRLIAERQVALEETAERIEHEVQERTSELSKSTARYRALVENTNAIPIEFDLATSSIVYIAPQAATMFGCSEAQLLEPGFLPGLVIAGGKALPSSLGAFLASGANHLDVSFKRPDGRVLELRIMFSPLVEGQPLRAIALDITQQRKLEAELGQAQKLESVGRLASGIAHEINTPVQFVSDSVHFLKEATSDLLGVVTKLQAVRDAVQAGQAANDEIEASHAAEETADLGYLKETMPEALVRSLDGLGRVAKIVQSMKEFAHPDRTDAVEVDLNRAIESTLTIARNEYKYVAELVTDYGALPPVRCHAGEINQVVLNIVVNAAHAIADRVAGTDQRGTITVRTRVIDRQAEISIADTGGGIPLDVRDRIFDPFFTTKAVGKGTGQGLAIARTVVVEKHHGELTFESEVGKGTTFLVRLPLEPALKEVG